VKRCKGREQKRTNGDAREENEGLGENEKVLLHIQKYEKYAAEDTREWVRNVMSQPMKTTR
jgi:hypothetical protein